MLKNKKLILPVLIALIIIIAGIVVIAIKDMNYDLMYGSNTTIEMYLKNDFVESDIEAIIKESLGNNYNIRLVNNLQNNIIITVKNISDEQIETLISKTNEKYGLELTRSDLIITNNGTVQILDLINPYIFPVTLVIIITMVYLAIKHKNCKVSKIILYTLITVIGIQAIYFSIYAITRIPVNQFTMPISMAILIISLLILEKGINNNIEEMKTNKIKA